MSTIKAIETSRITAFEVGEYVGLIEEDGPTVVSIDFGVGEPTMGVPSVYVVILSNGEKIEVSDVVEVWYSK